MPLYEYHCKDCDHDFTIERSIADPRNDVACSHCTSQTVFRVFANVGLTQLPTRGSNSLSKSPPSETSSKPAGAGAGDGDKPAGDNGSKPSTDTASPSKEPVKTSDA